MTGRPSDYSEEYCEQVVEWGKLGKSVAWMAAKLDVHKDTVYEWAKKHPAFSDALTRARAHSQAWWEDVGQDNLLTPYQGGTFNQAMWAKNMACRFHDEWREKQEIKHEGQFNVVATPGDESI